MRNIYLSGLLIVITAWACSAQALMQGMYNDYEGKLGELDISLSIYSFENGELKGNYCYLKNDTRITLTGKIVDNKIELTEFVNDKPTGHFEGKVFTDTKDRFEGTWTDNSKTNKLIFKLTLGSGVSASFGYRYSHYGTEESIENFMKRVKTAILTKDKQWLANNIHYPIKVHLEGTNEILIKGKNQLLENYDAIFYPAFVEKIKSLCTCNLFNNWQGIMLGDGQIWIESNSEETPEGLWIITLNNSLRR